MDIENKSVDEIIRELEKGVREVFQSDQYLHYLEVMSRFHNYSINNWRLIYNQFPNATLLAGYKQWKEKFGRYVIKGEKGIKILAPHYAYNRFYGFKEVTVFDVSQTAGRALPETGIKKWDLVNGVFNYNILQDVIKRISPLPITFEKLNGLDGKCCHNEKIIINKGMSEAQNILTMLHEIVHALLHSNNWLDEATKEVEAESVAYAVCKYLGIDTSLNSFGYIAECSNKLKVWSCMQPMEVLKSSLGRITEATKEIISKINLELEIEDSVIDTTNEDLLSLYEKGRTHFFGLGTEENAVMALKYFCAAGNEALLDEYASEQHDESYEGFWDRSELILDEHSKVVFQYYLNLANSGCCKSQYVIAYFYELGIGTRISEEDAFKWFLKAAKKGYRPAQYSVAICYKGGLGTLDNEKEYLYWFQKAAESGDVRAQYALGLENMLDIIDGANDADSFKWFLEAAMQGHIDAQFELGVCYYQGIGTEVDVEKAFYWYQKAMEQGNIWARLNLIHFYFNGIVVEKDIEKGIDILLDAVTEGDERARNYLIRIVDSAVNGGEFNAPYYRFN